MFSPAVLRVDRLRPPGAVAEADFPGQCIRCGRWRNSIQTLALALLVAVPLINFHWNITFIQGWYQSLGIGPLWIVSPLEGLESILVTRSLYWPLLGALILPVLSAAILGRVFCSWICPINTLQEVGDFLLRPWLKKRKPRDRGLLPKTVLWYILTAEFLMTLILGTPLWVFLSPPGLVGREIMTYVFFRTLATGSNSQCRRILSSGLLELRSVYRLLL